MKQKKRKTSDAILFEFVKNQPTMKSIFETLETAEPTSWLSELVFDSLKIGVAMRAVEMNNQTN